MLSFFIGTIVGGIVSIFVMALVYYERDNKND